jgi:glycerol-3-phosphate acyltransferase PlsY
MIFLVVLVVVSGYLLGSIPSAYLIGRFWGKIDLLQEGDSHVSATAVYRKVGRVAFLIVLIMDAAKGVLAVYLATLLTNSPPVLIAAAYAAVIGHCWPVYIRFRGGLGAVVTYAVLGTLAFWEFLVGVAVAIVLLFTTRKSSLSTYVLLAAASLMLLIERKELVIALFPLGLILIQLLKRFQSQKTSTASEYRNELFDDLKRLR